MTYLTTHQAAIAVGLSQERIRVLCTKGLIVGAFKIGKAWLVPRNFSITRNGTRGPRPALRPKSRTMSPTNEISENQTITRYPLIIQSTPTIGIRPNFLIRHPDIMCVINPQYASQIESCDAQEALDMFGWAIGLGKSWWESETTAFACLNKRGYFFDGAGGVAKREPVR